MSAVAESRLSRYALIVVIVMTALIYSGLDFNTIGLGIVKNWMLILLFAGLTLPLNLELLNQRLIISPLFVWCYCLLAMMLLWSIIAPSPIDSLDTIIAFGWFALALFLAYAMFRTEAARRIAIGTICAVVLVSTVTNLVMASQGAFRPAGLYRNPNTSGYALVMGMIVTHSFVPQKYRFLYQLFILAGIFVTASRASLVLWAASVFLLYVFGSEKRYYNRWAIASMVLLFGLALSPLGSGFLETLDDPNNDTARLLSLGSKEELEEDSRYTLAEMAFEEVQDHPIFGQGTGESTIFYDDMYFGTHNMYLSLMMQFGILGIVIIPALALILLGPSSPRWQFTIPFAVFLLIASFFDHNVLDQWHYALMFALMARLSGTEFVSEKARTEERAINRGLALA